MQATGVGVVAVRGSGEGIVCSDIDPSLAYDLDVLIADYERQNDVKVDPKSVSWEDLVGGKRAHASFIGEEGIAEAVAFKEAGVYFQCSYIAPPAVFDAQSALRIELFKYRIRLPQGGAAIATP